MNKRMKRRSYWLCVMLGVLTACGGEEPSGSCATTEHEDGSVTLQCGDEAPVTLSGPEGERGPAGEDGVEGPAGEDGMDGADGQTAAIRTEAATPEQCAYGGEVVYTGYDSDGSGALEAGEETQNFIICQGAPGDGKVALVVSSQADLNDCPTGGRRVEVGLDDDQSGALEANEILDAFNICNGAKGDTGEGGASALIEVVVDGATSCPAGGDLLHVGVDADGDGTLSSGERSGSFEVCDGQDGASCSVMDNNDGTKTITCTDGTSATVADGGACSTSDNGNGTKTLACEDGSSVIVSNGNNALVAVMPGGAQTCSNGGDLVQVGHDEDGDGVLAPAEVSDTFEVCRGDDGSDGQDGMNGAPGTDGMDGANGQDGANALVSITTDGAQNCPAGGDLLEVGVDTNANGLLDVSEVDASFEVCDGEGGQDGMDGAPGMDGQDGADGSSCSVTDNGDGSKTIACTDGSSTTVSDGMDGQDGTDGAPGQDGSNALLRTIEGGATSCPDGGDLIQAGVDDNNNGTLDVSEVDSSLDVCDGEAGPGGADGQDGLTSLIKITTEPPGPNCADGGQKLEVGLDVNHNGTLDTAEIDGSQTTYICGSSQPTVQLTAVSSGEDHSCALTGEGGVMCWGRNNVGQLGDGTTTQRTSPVDVVGLGSGVVSLASGADHNCALMTSGGLKCWGYNTTGQLGDGSSVNRLTPVDVSGMTSGVVAVSGGGHFTCAVTAAGALKCWGYNNVGQLGDGTTTDRSTPVDVVGATSGVERVEAGFYHACALDVSGGARCWGLNNQGQLGNGTTTNSSTPVSVSGLGAGVASLSAGEQHSCAVTTSGSLECWGLNSTGQLGDGSNLRRTTPVSVTGLSSGVASVSCGEIHTCAVTTSGALKCWGHGSSGKLGTGNTGSYNTPADVTDLGAGVAAVSSGADHTCAQLSGGGVKCWGYNSSGQLGDGTAMQSLVPVDVQVP